MSPARGRNEGRFASKEAFIFDLDGTLVNAYQAVQKSLNATRQQFGHPRVSLQEVVRKVGRGDEKFIRIFFPRREVRDALAYYRKRHETDVKSHSRLMRHARWILYFLKRKKKKLAVASNRPSRFTSFLVRKFDLEKYFDQILCADQVQSLKPDPKILRELMRRLKIEDAAGCVFVGDMDIDMETARRAKMDAVFVKGGSTPVRQVKKYRNIYIVSDLKEMGGMCGPA
ncbi:MAG: HAD-IA family hydrolase [Candidatus Omnitrophica bacterium]|nr:HAD-IA family hydrolase [Candidatus Omnitrophota bacterium]